MTAQNLDRSKCFAYRCRTVSSLSLAMNTLPVSVGWWLKGELGSWELEVGKRDG